MICESRRRDRHPQEARDGVQAVAEADSALVRRCKANDRRAFDDIVARYQDRVLNYVRGMVSDRDDADEIALDTFVRAYAGLRSFESRATLHTWLFRIATNLCIDYRRRRMKRGVFVSLDAPAASGDDVSPRDLPDSRYDPARVAADSELGAQLRLAIASLPDRLRAVVLLHDLEGLAYDEIAQVVGCPLGTVKSRLFHARMALRSALTPYLRGENGASSSQPRATKANQ